MPQIISYVGGVASGVVTIFTAIASSVYLLLQKDKLLRHARVLTRAFLPKSAAETTLRIATTQTAISAAFCRKNP